MSRAVQTAIDSLNFFVESRNAGNIISASATVSAAGTSPDQFNTAQRGAMFFVTIASVSVTSATVQLSINAKDPQSGVYFPYLKMSVDGLNATTTQGVIVLYVGAASAAGLNTAISNQLITMPLPNVFQVVTSMTISSTTATNSGTASLSVDYSKVM
jgi:hypothetical protein